MQAALISAAVTGALEPVGRIEAKLDTLADQMVGLIKLHDRVHALEVWQATTDARARAAAEAGHAYHRDTEEVRRKHQRLEDVIVAATTAIETLNHRTATTTATTTTTTTTDNLPSLPRWAVIGLASFVLIALALAMIGGERGLWTIKPNLPSATVTK
jgi:hypothetical protein